MRSDPQRLLDRKLALAQLALLWEALWRDAFPALMIAGVVALAVLTGVLAATGGGLLSPTAVAAQDTWISGWGGVFMDPATVEDDASGTEWDFGTSAVFGHGATLGSLQGAQAELLADLPASVLVAKGHCAAMNSPAVKPPTVS